MNRTNLIFLTGLIVCFLTCNIIAQEKYPRIKEDREARLEYEYQRLIDPATSKIPDEIQQKELLYIYSSQANLQPSLKANGRTVRASAWNRRGPFNVGGRTRALALDITDENTILAGGVSGAMWRSTNGGTSWTKTTASNQLHSTTCIAQDTRSGQTDTWYYGTGELTGNSASGGAAFFRGDGIFKSTDGGVTWTLLTATAGGSAESFTNRFQFVWNIVVNPVNGDVYAATFDAIYRSQNGGTSWTIVLGGGSNGDYSDIAVTSTGILYATMSSDGDTKGIYRSTTGDSGDWTDITPAALPTTYERVVLDIAQSNENVLYFLASTPFSGVGEDRHSLFKYTYVSGDGSGSGGSWEDRTSNLPSFGGSVGDLNQSNYNQYVKVKPDDENIVFIGSTNLYRSTDGFASTGNTAWVGGYSPRNNVSSYPNHHPDNHSLVFYPSDATKMISGHDGGLSVTTNNLGTNEGGTDGFATLPIAWASLNNGYFTTQAYAIGIDLNTAGDNRIMAGFQDNGKWTVLGTSESEAWREEEFGGDGAYVAIVSGKDIRYTSTQNGVIIRVEGSDIENPTNADDINPSGASGQLFINPFILDKNDQKIMYYPAGQYLWRNNDVEALEGGVQFNGTSDASWSRLNTTFVSGQTVTALDVSKSPANVLYYGTDDGRVFKLSNAQATSPSRTEITDASFPSGAYVSCIAVDNNDADKVFVIFSNYGVRSIWYSTDGGTSWTDVSGNLEENSDGSGNGPSVRWIATSDPTSSSPTYYVGTSTGLYSTTTLNGTSTDWTQEGTTSIGNVVVSMIQTRDADGVVVVGTHANGMYSLGSGSISGNIISLFPADGSTEVTVSPELQVTFNENVSKGTGTIAIKNKANDTTLESIDVTSSMVSTSGAIATIQIGTELPLGTNIYIEFPDGTFQKAAGGDFEGISGSNTWTFTITNRLNGILTLSPANGSTDVSISTELQITFNENVTTNAGNISIKNKTNNELISSIGVSSSEVRVSGAVATIQPNTALPAETELYVEFPDGTFNNASNESFKGIFGNRAWSFTTGTVTVTSVGENLFTEKLQIFPNPAQSELQVILSDSNHTVGKIEIYNLQGQLVTEKLLFPYESGELSTRLDVSTLTKGIYNIRIITGDFSETRKVIIE